ncbi:o-succinylbenzoate synthase [Leptolyngbya sp. FACHB-261]|uniref:o-succinylbenzoate synthase n=1 Tax=Leptolyngbya sp. FACHB-261 TaxID=2692806 RepID=UPI001682A3B9|nr:o-succinylbenzoate synthase [Leptolyngbya sp. FACHB-261]MBD2099376.1 o-succinylbenzoate synthase [Leptolyngbya sp. FACHB-261]
MPYRFEFRPYQRKFNQALQTHHGLWETRCGIILRLTAESGQIGFGEIAPLSWFGSESLEQALDFCHQLPTQIKAEDIFTIPTSLPACQFGLESAWELLQEQGFQDINRASQQEPVPIPVSGLLPAGAAALSSWQELWQQGYRTFKWKIGVAPIEQELQHFQALVQVLPSEAKLRLDANGGLTSAEAHDWLKACDQVGVEFLEQPLPVEQFDTMLSLSQQYTTPLALDESVAQLNQLEACYRRGWRGVFVIKPAIVGSPKRLRQFCQTYAIDAVFSSVFETSIGQQAGLKLVLELGLCHQAQGYGTNHWFPHDGFGRSNLASPELSPSSPDFSQTVFQALWNRL